MNLIIIFIIKNNESARKRSRHNGGFIIYMKEVIQGHLPVALPCYDFRSVIGPTVGVILLKKVELTTSG
jgi:hypothetical protein